MTGVCQVLYKFIVLQKFPYRSACIISIKEKPLKLRESGKLILGHKVSEWQNQNLDTGQTSFKIAPLCQVMLSLNKSLAAAEMGSQEAEWKRKDSASSWAH